MKLYKYILAGTLCGLMLSTAACGSKDVTADNSEAEQQEVETNIDTGEDTTDSNDTDTATTDENSGSTAPGSFAGGQLNPGSAPSPTPEMIVIQDGEYTIEIPANSEGVNWQEEIEEEYDPGVLEYSSDYKWGAKIGDIDFELPMTVAELEDKTGKKLTVYITSLDGLIEPGKTMMGALEMDGWSAGVEILNKSTESLPYEDCIIKRVNASAYSWQGDSEIPSLNTPVGMTWGADKSEMIAAFKNAGYTEVPSPYEGRTEFAETTGDGVVIGS